MTEETPLYDRPDFLKAYLELPRQQKGHDGASEWPTLRKMIGDVKDQKALDLGCGLGWFSRYATESGAVFVDASDISVKMVEGAQARTPKELQDKIKYDVADLNTIELEIGAYDIVYSSLTFHYLSNASFTRLLRQIHASLKPNGRLVFSVEHPIFTAPSHPRFQKQPDGSEIWPLNSYADEGLRETEWLGGVRKYHRTLTTYLKGLLEEGFILTDIMEWMTRKEDLDSYPEWKNEAERPMFLLIKAHKMG